MTVTRLAEMMARFVDRPVVDLTGLTGPYDFTASLSPEDYTAVMIRTAVNAGISLPPRALRMLDAAPLNPLSNGLQTVGLSLDGQKAPLDVIVVDSMMKAPTDN